MIKKAKSSSAHPIESIFRLKGVSEVNTSTLLSHDIYIAPDLCLPKQIKVKNFLQTFQNDAQLKIVQLIFFKLWKSSRN